MHFCPNSLHIFIYKLWNFFRRTMALALCDSEIILRNPHVTILVPNIVNEIYVTLDDNMNKVMLQVKHHDTTFKVVPDFLYPLKGTNILVVPIITLERMMLPTDEMIATVSPVAVSYVFDSLTGIQKLH